MNWRRWFLLSYAETRDFSERRSLMGILLIVGVCLVAGLVSLYAHGQLTSCIPTYQSSFSKAQVEDGKEGCQGATLSVGQLLYGYSFTYVVTQRMDEFRDDPLDCSFTKRSATINLLSFAAPQFLWDYEISCSRPPTCCPADIQKTTARSISCFCDQTLKLNIQDFSVGSIGGDKLLSNSKLAVSNYSSLNGTISGIKLRKCPGDGNPITVLRFDNTTYSAFTSSDKCSGTAGEAFQDPTITAVLQTIGDSVDEAINADIAYRKDYMLRDINYLCYTCSSSTHELGQLLLNFMVAVAAIGSVTYSIVLWMLKATQREKSVTNNSVTP